MPPRLPIHCPRFATPSYQANRAAERIADNRFYNSARWRKFRAWFLSQYPLCTECGAIANQVDHIVKRKASGADPLDAANCQSLCPSCHSKKTRSGR